jgi:hypothetical protein
MEKKICSKCDVLKILPEFYKDSKYKDGVSSVCRECKKIINRNYRESNVDAYKKQQKKYRDSNLEKEKLRVKNWCLKNKKHRSKYSTQYEKIRKETDPKFKILRNSRNRLYNFLFKKHLTKPKKTIQLFGCEMDVLKNHLESLFTENMSWDNYGKNGWHIDHIIPLSSANSEEEIIKLCHYTNLQPLWSEDNLKKSNRF